MRWRCDRCEFVLPNVISTTRPHAYHQPHTAMAAHKFLSLWPTYGYFSTMRSRKPRATATRYGSRQSLAGLSHLAPLDRAAVCSAVSE